MADRRVIDSFLQGCGLLEANRFPIDSPTPMLSRQSQRVKKNGRQICEGIAVKIFGIYQRGSKVTGFDSKHIICMR